MAAPEAPLYYQGVSRTSPAFRLLKQMGWQEGEGLGKEKQGITQHVRVSKKADNSGVGVDAQQKAAANWTFNTSTFDNILKNLKVIAAGDANEEDNKQAASAESNGMQEKTARPKKVTRPQGRYKNREAGKILQGKSQNDLDAILGYRSDAKEVLPVIEVAARSNGKQIRTPESSQIQKQELTYCSVVQDCTVEVEQSVDVMTVNMPTDWWGLKHGFVRAGGLGQSYCLKVQEKSNQDVEIVQSNSRASFCEQDQENLYKLVQDKATKGRQGLGIADRPKKIGGAHWKGHKVLLHSDDEEEEDLESKDFHGAPDNISNAANQSIIDNQNGCVLSTEGKRKVTETSSAYDRRKSKKLKEADKANWKKICKQLIRELPDQTISIKRLHKVIVEKSDLYVGLDADDHEGMIDLLKEKLNKSSKFILEGKRVSFASAS